MSVSCDAFIHREHAKALSARQAVAQSRKSRGFFSFFKRGQPDYRPTYNHKADSDACRIYGTLNVKKVTGEYALSGWYVVHRFLCQPIYISLHWATDTRVMFTCLMTVRLFLVMSPTCFNDAVVEMNLSHVITEFSFGPYFPDIAQPLDYSFELAKERKSSPF